MGEDEEESEVEMNILKQVDMSSSDESESSIAEKLKPMSRSSLFNWGKSKRQYYEGDINDLEIGQEEKEALEEEEAGKEIQRIRHSTMAEEDFMVEFDEEKE